MSTVLLVGGQGQLGQDLQHRWAERHPGDTLISVGHRELDVTIPAQIEAVLQRHHPSLVINCAAFHRVDDIEDHPEPAFAVNAVGVRNLAVACRAHDAVLLHLSTDYVFSGVNARTPHVESQPVDPPNVYAASKAAGEMLIRLTRGRHFIVRSCGLYGVAGSAGKGGNFVETMLRLGRERKPIKVVDDQTLTPTSTWALADQISLLVTSDRFGTYHATCHGECSWFEFAAEIFRQAGVAADLKPQSSAEAGYRAVRPVYSVLENANLQRSAIDVMPAWQDALRTYLEMRAAARARG